MIKLIPPLIIGEREVDRFVEAFTAVMDDAHGGGGLMWDFGKTLVKQAVADREPGLAVGFRAAGAGRRPVPIGSVSLLDGAGRILPPRQ